MTKESRFKQTIASLYDRAAPIYDQVGPSFFQEAAARLVDLADVGAGARVLDIGTGRGAVLLAAAGRVGPTGLLVGIDLSEGMVREAAGEIRRRGFRNAAVLRMDAEHLAFGDGAFDVVLCSFAIFFFPRLVETLADLRRVLRPGGVIGIALASSKSDPRWHWHHELIARYATIEAPPESIRTRSLREPGDLDKLLRTAGFFAVQEVIEDADVTYRDADEWWEALWTHGERRALEAMTPENLALFHEATYRNLAEMTEAGPLTRTNQFVFAIGTRPMQPFG
jgi:ubiquinone/menaquinone biosynthesis C-methylase UbiE